MQVIHVVGNFMRIWSVYSMYHYLSQQGDQVVVFLFSCLVPASIIFLLLQKPWKGRPLANSQVCHASVLPLMQVEIHLLFSCIALFIYLFIYFPFLSAHHVVFFNLRTSERALEFQVVPSVVNGGIMSLYFILWGKGLLSCGPLM